MDLLRVFNFLPQLWMYYSCPPEEKPITYQDQAQCVRYDKMFILLCAVYIQSYDHKLTSPDHDSFFLYCI